VQRASATSGRSSYWDSCIGKRLCGIGRAPSPHMKRRFLRSFLRGLRPAATTLDKPPTGCLYLHRDPAARRAGLRVGDIIVGLEGWRVEKVEQYMSINAFFAKPEMKIAVWRGTLLNVETVMPGRLFGVDLKSYPLQGWIER
jgi:hypothetical protein